MKVLQVALLGFLVGCAGSQVLFPDAGSADASCPGYVTDASNDSDGAVTDGGAPGDAGVSSCGPDSGSPAADAGLGNTPPDSGTTDAGGGPDAGCVIGTCPWCTPPDGGTGPGATCSIDGYIVACCAAGEICPTPVHGHNTACCVQASNACASNGECCSGSCANGQCLPGGAFTYCGTNADCADGQCGGAWGPGKCNPLEIGQPCAASNECDDDLYCGSGICSCVPAGTQTPGGISQECCGGWSSTGGGGTGQCGCSSTGLRCMTNADCCGGGGGRCVSYVCN